MSPFQALFGRPPPTIPTYPRGSTSIQALDDLLQECDALLRTLKDNLQKAQHRMRQKANAHHRELELAVGDQVLLSLHPYRQTTVARRPSQKLAKRYYGPFVITERIGPVAYRLDLPKGSKIHPVFHVSVLKPYRGSPASESYPLPPEIMVSHPVSLPAAICATRLVLNHGKADRQVLVQWKDSSPENATWESFDAFCKLYPTLHLEDKVGFQGEGNDTTLPIQLGSPNSSQKIRLEEEAKPASGPESSEPAQAIRGPARTKKPPTWLNDYVV